MQIPEIKLKIDPQTREAEDVVGFEWNSEVGDRSELGGEPDWEQSEEWPLCCEKKMTFYGQLDSIGDDVCLADCGMIYVFVCFDCFSVNSVLQSS